VSLRDVAIRTALTIPNADDGVEIAARLILCDDGETSRQWYTFTVESSSSGEAQSWTTHCRCRITAASTPRGIVPATPVDPAALTQRVSSRRWYESFRRVGFSYTKTFQQLQQVRSSRNLHHAVGDVTVRTNVMNAESRYLIHPATVDACLQLIIISIHAGRHKEMPWGVVPTRIEEMTLFPANSEAETGHAVAWTDKFESRRFNTHAQLVGPEGNLLMTIKSLTCVTYDAAPPAKATDTISEPFSIVRWQPDITSLTGDAFLKTFPGLLTTEERLSKITTLIHHHKPLRRILLCGQPGLALAQGVLENLPEHVNVTIGSVLDQDIFTGEQFQGRVVVKSFTTLQNETAETDESYDLVVVQSTGTTEYEVALTFVKDGGWLLGTFYNPSVVPLPTTLHIGEQFALIKPQRERGGLANGNGNESVIEEASSSLLLLSLDGSRSLSQALSQVSTYSIREEPIRSSLQLNSFVPNGRVVVDDTTGTLLDAMVHDAAVFETVQAVLICGATILWLTRGVQQGQTPKGGMAEGLLRTLRSEQAAARIVLLDVDMMTSWDQIAGVVTQKLESPNTKDSGEDTEFWLHDGALHVARLFPDIELNSSGLEEMKVLPRGVRLNASDATAGGLVFEREKIGLADDQVELQVATAMSVPSWSKALVLGTVLKTGRLVDDSLIGQSVLATTSQSQQTIIRASVYAVVSPAIADIESSVGVVSYLAPLVNMWNTSESSKQGSFTLVVPGSKQTVAMLSLAKEFGSWGLGLLATSLGDQEEYISHCGFPAEEVFLIPESNTFEGFLDSIPRKEQVTVICLDGFSQHSQEIWRSMPPKGRFLVSLDTDHHSELPAPDSLPFSRGSGFFPVSCQDGPSAKILQISVDLISRSPDRFLHNPYVNESFDVIDIGEATGVNRESGKALTLVKYQYEKSLVKV
jgi:Polyketide synthase dehydratase